MRVEADCTADRASIMNGTTSQCAGKSIAEEEKRSQPLVRPAPLRTVSWNETVAAGDFEIPGTPKTPRTSTTPGTLRVINARRKKIIILLAPT